METKAEIFKNALNLSAEELTEVAKIREHINRVLEKDLWINQVNAGFSYLEVSVYINYTDFFYRTYRIMEDGTTYIHSTTVGLIQVTSEVGEVILNEIRDKQQNNKYLDIRLLPL